MEPKRNRNLTVADSDKKRNYHEEGRLTPKTGGGYQLEYTLKDHLRQCSYYLCRCKRKRKYQCRKRNTTRRNVLPFWITTEWIQYQHCRRGEQVPV
jgi:hypothetical protein